METEPLISVVIPVYNEGGTIAHILDRVGKSLLPRKEIIVVNDGSSDGTEQFLRTVSENGIKVIHHLKNRGKGAALATAIKVAKGDILIFQDADLEYDPKDYLLLLEPIQTGKSDIVYGSRITGGHTAMFFWYYLGNRFLTFLLNLLFNVSLSDVETGSKVFRREVLENMILRSSSFDVEIEVTAKAIKRGYKIYEVPISYSARRHSEGKKLTWKDGISALFAILRYRLFD